MYPNEKPHIAERFRGILHNKIEDCTGCGACVRACPISCIHLETLKRSKQNTGKASDGTAIKLWTIQYDVNNAECMVCGLCTEPCPTHCLTMSHDYELAVPARKGMWYTFATEADKEAAKLDQEIIAKEKAEKAAAMKAAKEAKAKEEAAKQAAEGKSEEPEKKADSAGDAKASDASQKPGGEGEAKSE
jgi:NADH-quinone oxidoreductase subunit I